MLTRYDHEALTKAGVMLAGEEAEGLMPWLSRSKMSVLHVDEKEALDAVERY